MKSADRFRTSVKILWIMLAVLAVAAGLLVFAVYTTGGSRFAAKVAGEFLSDGDMSYQDLEGSLAAGMTFRDLEITDIKNLPAGSVLRIAELFVDITSFGLEGLVVSVDNMRLRLPDSDPIVIAGTFKEQQWDLNIFSKGFTVNEVLSYLPDFRSLVPVRGEVNDIDLFVTGPLWEPVIKGQFTVGQFFYKGFILSEAPLTCDLQLKDLKKDIRLHGNVDMERGQFLTKRVKIQLDRGSLAFEGPWDKPRIDLNGRSKVEKANIIIHLKGTVEEPELILTSEPPLSRQKLMVMLATGKSWQSFEASADGQFNTAAVTKDFIDYFFFAGRSNAFAERFGISEFSVTYNGEQKGIAAKKELSDKLEVGYGVNETRANGRPADVSQTIEGAYKVNDRLSVGVEREMTTSRPDDLEEEEA